MWLLGKALQNVISKNLGKFVTITFVSNEVFGYDSVFGARLDSDLKVNIKTFDAVLDYTSKNIRDKNDYNYIVKVLEALAYANDLLFFTDKNPKFEELRLLRDIRGRLGILKKFEGWHGDLPNMGELVSFLGISRNLIDALMLTVGTQTSIYRVFNADELKIIARNLKRKLAPIDPIAYKDLLSRIKAYDSGIRRDELKRKFPTLSSFKEYSFTSIHGDVESQLPSNWDKIKTRALSVFYSEQGLHKKDDGKYYAFDSFTGRVYTADLIQGKPPAGWQLHHIDHDETNNNINNLLWTVKEVDSLTGGTGHRTTFSSDKERREYIAQGIMTKLSFKYGFAPRFWTLERQAYFNYILFRHPRSFII